MKNPYYYKGQNPTVDLVLINQKKLATVFSSQSIFVDYNTIAAIQPKINKGIL